MSESMSIEFKPYGKTPRLFRDMILTEKIDGTNAGVGVERVPLGTSLVYDNLTEVVVDNDSCRFGEGPTHEFIVWAQSRNRVITPGKSSDNAGFAGWVQANAVNLVAALGEGLHHGEWFGEGIQANPLGITGKRWALFNTGRYGAANFDEFGLPDVETVPVLYHGPFSTTVIAQYVDFLKENGSQVGGSSLSAEAEGLIVWHGASRQVFKVLCDSDSLPKGLRDAA